MTDQPTGAHSTGLAGIAAAARQAPGRGLPPVHLWHPEHCGDIDILIRADGTWMHEGSPIGRKELPFRAVTMQRRETPQGGGLAFMTDVGDEVLADAEHPIVVETDAVTGEPAPRILVRGGLEARIARTVFYDLVEMAEVIDGRLTVSSAGQRFPLGPVGAGVE
jgi:hypothetical protein